ncbi:MAG: hypothetical protein V4501_11170 [Pseudomonadota bacterium]
MKAVKQTDKLVELVVQAKNHEKDWDSYWHPNVENFVSDTAFIHVSTNTPNDLKMLKVNKQPQIQFNITKPYVERENSKFLEMQPSFTFNIRHGFPVTPKNIALSNALRLYFGATYRPQDNDYALAKGRKDCTNGGFSGFFIYPDYINDYTTHQKVCFKKVDNVLQMGFDPMAKEMTKCDGDFAFYREYPTLAEIKRHYGAKAAEAASTRASRNASGYPRNIDSDETVRCTYYYYKEWYKTRIVKLSTGQHMAEKLAKEVIKAWKPGRMAIKPEIIEAREVDRYRICKLVYAYNGYVLEHDTDTVYNELPLVYVDGQSELIASDTTGTTMRQMTASLIKHAIDIQRTKNAMGQSIVMAAQNIGVTKWSVSLQALPQETAMQKGFFDPDTTRAVLWNEYDPKNTMNRTTPPREVSFSGATPEQFQMFTYMDQLFQSSMATYDPSAPGMANNNMSGKAIYAGDAQAQMVSQPGMLGMTAAMAQLAKIELHMMTQLIKDERQIPQTTNGTDIDYIWVNKLEEDGISLDFDSDMFSIEVSPGVSTSLQKAQTLESIVSTAKVLPTFAQFCNDPKTIPHILGLLPGGDLDVFRLQYNEWLKKQEQQPPQPNPQQIQDQLAQQKLALQGKELDFKVVQALGQNMLKKRDQDIQVGTAILNAEVAQAKNTANIITAIAKVDEGATEMELKQERVDAENTRSGEQALLEMDEHAMKREKHEMDKQSHAKMMSELPKQSGESESA